MGVLLSELGEDESERIVNEHIGKVIKELVLDKEYNYSDGGLRIRFEDGSEIIAYDDGRSCCEERYMHTDDDLESFTGSIFKGVSVSKSKNFKGDWDVHEIRFLNVHTDLGVIVMETHNIHNGYYGGFYVKVRKVKDAEV